MKHFFNGFSLLFNPFGAIELFMEKEDKPDNYFVKVFDYLAKTYYHEKKALDPKKRGKRKDSA